MNLLSGRLESAPDGMRFVEDRPDGNPLRLLLPQKMERLGQAQQNVILGVRPEDIIEQSTTPGPWDASLTLELAEPMGAETYLHLTTGKHSCITRVPPRPTPPPNSLVPVRFNLDRAHLFDAASGLNLVTPERAGV